MDDLFSPQAERLLLRAQQSARSLGHVQVGLADLLAAFVDELDPQTSNVLDQSFDRWQRLRQQLPSAPDSANPAEPLPVWSAESTEVIRRAKEIALAFRRHEQVQSTDIAVALLETPGLVATIPDLTDWPIANLLARFHQQREPALIDLPAELDWKSVGHPDLTDLYQILDANLNRAREGLRVVEEYARFAQGQTVWTRSLKEFRHRLAEIEAALPTYERLAARDTAADVGAEHTSRHELSRETIRDVAAINWKRTQEALRAIEEYAKVTSPRASQLAKTLRYDVYQMERLAGLAADAHERLADARLYWICDPHACPFDLEWTVRQAVAGGVRVIQLRDKAGPDRQTLHLARQLRQWTIETGALFIMNDRPDLARLAEADGVHVGQEELTVREARRIVGPDALVGVSTHSLEQAIAAVEEGASYLGVGPIFPSTTKSFTSYVGTDLLSQVTERILLPWFAIGGIDAKTLPMLVAAGVTRVAVAGAISQSDDPCASASALLSGLSQPSQEA
ncbi:thiamine phosphate synthase [bacterium]|nr:thiamine phosphate synthase [bacterium]